MRLPSHVYRAAGGVYYFRYVLPQAIRQIVGKTEIRRSLRTRDVKEARTRAFTYFLAVEKTIGGGMDGIDLDSIGKFELDYSPTKGIKLKVEPNNPQDSEAAQKALETVLTLQGTLQAPATEKDHQPAKKHAIGVEIAKYLALNGEKWHPKTRAEYQLILNRFANHFVRRSVNTIKKDDIVDYVTHLQNSGTGMAARDKHVGTIRGFFEHAATIGIYPPNEALPTDAHKGLKKRDKRSMALRSGWLMFDDADLQKLFDPANEPNLKPHEYYLPILGLLTAARIGELCQLYVSDIRLVEGIICINISNTGPGQSVKTAAAIRSIPLHPTLIDVGFLDYVDIVRKKHGSDARLFPYLRVDNVNGLADVPSEFFSRHKKKCGIIDTRKVFHSFRKTANDRLKQNGVPEEIRCQILGHEYESVNSRIYSNGLGVKSLSEIIRQHLTFPTLDFSHIRYSPEITERLEAEMARRAKYDMHNQAKALRKTL